VGIEKRKYMSTMYTGAELAAMLDLKHLLDPHGLLNPGKIFPAIVPPARYAEPTLPPSEHFAPANAEEAAANLLGCTQHGQSVRVGSAAAGDRQGADRWLSTSALQGVQRFAINDLYVTVGAGTAVGALQSFLHEHKMQAPLATPWPTMSIGGLIAANLNAPLRMRYGALRDVMIATTVALADGRVIRAGRSVVKNVAGYDLPKLFVGSQGTLGVLTDVTVKLIPLPHAQRTLAVAVDDWQQGLAWALKVLPQLFVASGLVLCQRGAAPGLLNAPFTLLITAEGVPEDVDTELEEVTTALWQAGAPQPHAFDQMTGTAAWAAFLQGVPGDALSVRAGLPVKELPRYVAGLTAEAHAGTRWCVDVANGLVYGATTPATPGEAQIWLDALRLPAQALGGYAVALQTPPVVQGAIHPWGYRPDSLDLMRGLKTRWDPAGILNPGTFLL
jgi:D-lactate dehydrogenase (cytochrome)